jgi:hypothetical protein
MDGILLGGQQRSAQVFAALQKILIFDGFLVRQSNFSNDSAPRVMYRATTAAIGRRRNK